MVYILIEEWTKISLNYEIDIILLFITVHTLI